MTTAPNSSDARERLGTVRAEVAKAVVGQDAAVSGLLVSLLCGGHVLMEGVPPGVDLATVRAELQAHPRVSGVHDLHVWALASRSAAMSGISPTMKNTVLIER